jgi:hypothetical protein
MAKLLWSGYDRNRIPRARDNAVTGWRQILHIIGITGGGVQIVSKHSSRLSALAVYRRAFWFNLAPTRGRSGGSSRITVRFLHLSARLAIAVTCTSSAAAFDAAHILHKAVVISERCHSLGVQWHEAKSSSQPVSADAHGERYSPSELLNQMRRSSEVFYAA